MIYSGENYNIMVYVGRPWHGSEAILSRESSMYVIWGYNLTQWSCHFVFHRDQCWDLTCSFCTPMTPQTTWCIVKLLYLLMTRQSMLQGIINRLHMIKAIRFKESNWLVGLGLTSYRVTLQKSNISYFLEMCNPCNSYRRCISPDWQWEFGKG